MDSDVIRTEIKIIITNKFSIIGFHRYDGDCNSIIINGRFVRRCGKNSLGAEMMANIVAIGDPNHLENKGYWGFPRALSAMTIYKHAIIVAINVSRQAWREYLEW